MEKRGSGGGGEEGERGNRRGMGEDGACDGRQHAAWSEARGRGAARRCVQWLQRVLREAAAARAKSERAVLRACVRACSVYSTRGYAHAVVCVCSPRHLLVPMNLFLRIEQERTQCRRILLRLLRLLVRLLPHCRFTAQL